MNFIAIFCCYVLLPYFASLVSPPNVAITCYAGICDYLYSLIFWEQPVYTPTRTATRVKSYAKTTADESGEVWRSIPMTSLSEEHEERHPMKQNTNLSKLFVDDSYGEQYDDKHYGEESYINDSVSGLYHEYKMGQALGQIQKSSSNVASSSFGNKGSERKIMKMCSGGMCGRRTANKRP